MDPRQAVEHASAVAREAARLGLAARDPLLELFQDYQGYVRQGGTASFTELLLTRGVIGQAAYVQLDQAVPLAGPIPAHLRASQGSQGFQVPPPARDPWLADPGAGGPPKSWKHQTLDFDDVLEAQGAGRQTGIFDQVLETETRGHGQRTGVYDQVLAPPGSRYALPPGATETSEYGQVIVPEPDPLAGSDRRRPGSEKLAGSDRRRPGSEKLAGSDRRRPGSEKLAGSDRRRPGSEKLAGSGKQAFPSGGLPDLADSDYESDVIEPDSTDRLPIESEPRPGDVMGPYTLEKVLGRGGMGIIYRAHKPGSEQRVALKVLVSAQEPGDQSGRKRQRFRREFEALRRLEHPHIVGVHDYGRQDPFDWYAMDYVAGFDFEQVLLRDRLDRAGKLVVFQDVCQAMAHAHARHVIHRDLKPQNVIVDDLGRGHVLDFGLAKILDQGLQMTRSGSTLGTPFYIAPEQLRSARDVDARADVFALGVILYELLVGRRPFDGETAAEVGNQILTADPSPPSQHDASIHRDLDAICLRALEKEPDQRYEDAAALHADLERHQQGLGVARRRSLLGGVRRWVRRHRAGILGGLIASGILVPIVLYLALRLARGTP